MTRLSGSDPPVRVNGVQMHPTSLPGGRLGEAAFAFVDWLAEAGQSYWQVLPLGPIGEGGSPYKSPSAFAGSPELLAEPDARGHRRGAGGAARARGLLAARLGGLRGRRRGRGPGALRPRVGGAARLRGRARRADHRRPADLRRRRRRRPPRPPGALPDRRAGRRPPDAFSATGQLWGNPLYDWPALRRRRYRWWVERLRRTSQLVDLVADRPLPRLRRLLVGAGRATPTPAAATGRAGPGRALFEAIRARARRAAAGRREPRRDHRRRSSGCAAS